MGTKVHTVDTLGGVTDVDERPGKVEIIRQAGGDTVVSMRVTDGWGTDVTVYLGYDELVQLAVKSGAMAIDTQI